MAHAEFRQRRSRRRLRPAASPRRWHVRAHRRSPRRSARARRVRRVSGQVMKGALDRRPQRRRAADVDGEVEHAVAASWSPWRWSACSPMSSINYVHHGRVIRPRPRVVHHRATTTAPAPAAEPSSAAGPSSTTNHRAPQVAEPCRPGYRPARGPRRHDHRQFRRDRRQFPTRTRRGRCATATEDVVAGVAGPDDRRADRARSRRGDRRCGDAPTVRATPTSLAGERGLDGSGNSPPARRRTHTGRRRRRTRTPRGPSSIAGLSANFRVIAGCRRSTAPGVASSDVMASTLAQLGVSSTRRHTEHSNRR